MADFWDDHDFTDFEDEFEEAPAINFDIKDRRYHPISLETYEKKKNRLLRKGYIS